MAVRFTYFLSLVLGAGQGKNTHPGPPTSLTTEYTLEECQFYKYKNLIDVEVSTDVMVRVSKCPHNKNYFLHGALLMRAQL